MRNEHENRSSYEYDECDSDERIAACLNCPFPAETCLGEKKCIAQTRLDKLSIQQSILYARDKGYTVRQIARALELTEDYVRFQLRKNKKGIKQNEGNESDMA